MALILVVDDDELIRILLSEYLLLDNHTVRLADSISSAQASLLQQVPEIIITDLIMPEHPGTELIQYLKLNFPAIPIIAISGGGRHNAMSPLNEAQSCGADYTLEKPIAFDKLKATLAKILGT